MAISATIREMESALEEIRKEESGTFDAIIFGLLAEICQYEKLRQNKLPAAMMEKRWQQVMTRAIAIAKDWHAMKSLDDQAAFGFPADSLENTFRNGGATL